MREELAEDSPSPAITNKQQYKESTSCSSTAKPELNAQLGKSLQARLIDFLQNHGDNPDAPMVETPTFRAFAGRTQQQPITLRRSRTLLALLLLYS